MSWPAIKFHSFDLGFLLVHAPEDADYVTNPGHTTGGPHFLDDLAVKAGWDSLTDWDLAIHILAMAHLMKRLL